jgi:flagellar protein FliJ
VLKQFRLSTEIYPIMQKPSKRLKTVLKLAQLKQKQTAERLGKSQQAFEAQIQQAQQLESYQTQYNHQFNSDVNRPVSALQISNYMQFFNSLGGAVEVQYQRKQQAESQLDLAREQWQQSYAREQNMQSLIEKKEREEAKDDENKLQRMLDDRTVFKPGSF